MNYRVRYRDRFTREAWRNYFCSRKGAEDDGLDTSVPEAR
jgi:hypothetical protein